MWPNQSWGFGTYNGLPHRFPTNFMQNKYRDQLRPQQFSMEQTTGPSFDPGQEKMAEKEEKYDISPQQQGNREQNLSRLEISPLARELKEKVKQSMALRQSKDKAVQQQSFTKPQPKGQDVQEMINNIIERQDQGHHPTNISELTGSQEENFETEKPAATLPTTPRVLKKSPLSTYPIPVYCPELPQGCTNIQDDILDNALGGPKRSKGHTAQASCAKECGERDMDKLMANTDLKTSSSKNEEHKGTKTIDIPSVVTDGDLEQDVIMWLQQTGFYNKAKRTDALARWKGLAKAEKALARLQPVDKGSGFTLTNTSKVPRETNMGTKPGAVNDGPQVVCRPEQDDRGSSQATSVYMSKPSKKRERGRGAGRHRSSSPRGRSVSWLSQRADGSGPAPTSKTPRTPPRAPLLGHREYREYRDDRDLNIEP
ncbi:uncharacterized protein PgNI_08681 [Pyricularia grisea]|uniref:Uncharacterized protein n=1 Tax=Pyricularia grisea TaxID=148305 RepID=A0A6P8AUN9_PYRGI|nr:uncharacterized protein PgNI_08681 [Pyricularia grisea]TLD05927.1 hypothetical protein PgNI_08681 [Pyricularia grisea]